MTYSGRPWSSDAAWVEGALRSRSRGRRIGVFLIAACVVTTTFAGYGYLMGPSLPPARSFSLSIDSTPTGIPFTIDGVNRTTPHHGPLRAGDHTIAMPWSAVVGGIAYRFRAWTDGGRDPTRTIDLTGDNALAATYARPVAATPVATDSAVGVLSLTTMGAHKFLADSRGHLIVVYVNDVWAIAVAVNNGDPMRDAWSPPFVSERGFARPAAVLAADDTLHVLAERASGIFDVVVHLQRDPGGRILGGTFDAPILIGPGGGYPSATRAHDGSVWAVWNVREATGSSYNASRLIAGHWTPESGWTSRAIAVDTENTERFYATIIERPDTFTLYVFANRGELSPDRNLLFVAASFSIGGWTWQPADLAYETIAARGISDSTSAAWDPVRRLVVVVNDHTGTPSFFAFTLDSNDRKTHLDTPAFGIVNNDWGTILVDSVTGDYYLVFLETFANTVNGRILFARWDGHSWSDFSVLDAGDSDIAVQVRAGGGPIKDFVFGRGFTSGAVRICYGRID
jgi:hypothetical protein